jgi:DNA-binding transcriptional LysR family regulator
VRAVFERAFAAAPIRPRIGGEFTSIAAMRSLVEAGAGCALVPESAARDSLDNGRTARLPWPSVAVTPVTMRWRQQRTMPPALRRLLDVARRTMAA